MTDMEHFAETELGAACLAASSFGDDGVSFVEAFEQELALAFHVSDAVVVSSDSAAVSVLCGALKLGPGDAVATQSLLPAWALGALQQARINPADSYGGWQEKSVKALIHIYANDIETVRKLRRKANQAGIPLIVDMFRAPIAATQAVVAAADVVIIHADKDQALSMGEGGILLFNDAVLAEEARSYAQFGRLDGIRLGVNHKLSQVQAAIGRVRLRKLQAAHAIHGQPPRILGETPRKHQSKIGIGDRFNPRTPGDHFSLAIALANDLDGSSETVAHYEAALGQSFGADHALSVSSGYAAVLVALSALGLIAGDEVLLTPTCPLCTVFALTSLGVIPVFCDTRPDCFSIDLEMARSCISPRTRAIVEIPMWGYPVPADEVADFARRNGLALVLDLALGHGTELGGELIWRHADLATFSTHGSKILVTGEGGFVLTQHEHLASAARQARHYGSAPSGLNYRLAAPQAALGLARLPALAEHIRLRRTNMGKIGDALHNERLSTFPVSPTGNPSGVKLLIQDNDGLGEELNDHLARNGVPSDIRMYRCRPLYEFPVLAERRAECPNATRLLASIATLPVHPGIGAEERDHIVAALNSYRGG